MSLNHFFLQYVYLLALRTNLKIASGSGEVFLQIVSIEKIKLLCIYSVYQKRVCLHTNFQRVWAVFLPIASVWVGLYIKS